MKGSQFSAPAELRTAEFHLRNSAAGGDRKRCGVGIFFRAFHSLMCVQKYCNDSSIHVESLRVIELESESSLESFGVESESSL